MTIIAPLLPQQVPQQVPTVTIPAPPQPPPSQRKQTPPQTEPAPPRVAPKVINPRPGSEERFQGLVRRLVARSSAPSVIGLTSTGRGEGVSTLTGQLAAAAAETLQQPVLAVDANLAHPGLESRLGVERQQLGWREILAREAAPKACLGQTPTGNLTVLGPGQAASHSSPAHDQAAWGEMLSLFRQNFALVLVDLPPVESLFTQFTLTDVCDGILLVVEAERARRKAVVRAKDQLSGVRAELIGVVLNKRRTHIPSWLYEHV